MPNFYSVVGCGSRGNRDLNSFFRIPVIPRRGSSHIMKLKTERRLKWIAALKRTDLTETKLKYATICDKHFITDQAIRRTGFDESFINAAIFHLNVYFSKLDERNIKSKNDYCDLLLSTLFLNQIDTYPTQRFKCQVNENSDWPLPVLPSEVFGETKLDHEYRKKAFYKCLQVGDLLDCRVASVLPTEYHLRVIHKYGASRILDDLNIIVVMSRNDSESLVLKKELLPCELIRVSVLQINSENDEKVYVTISNNAGELEENKKLGKISEEHLPAYVLDPPEYSCTYSDYLNSLPGLRNPLLLNDFLEGFGINPRGVYSSYPTSESMKPVDGNLLLKEVNLSNVKQFTDLALQEFEAGNFQQALDSVRKAIQFYPTEDQTKKDKTELGKLYEMRGKIHLEIDKQGDKLSKNCISDWELAAKLNPFNFQCNKEASKISFQIANRFYRNKNYRKAAVFAEMASKVDKDNIKALDLLGYLKSKHPEVFGDLEEESLISLQEKKRELVSELLKIHSLKI